MANSEDYHEQCVFHNSVFACRVWFFRIPVLNVEDLHCFGYIHGGFGILALPLITKRLIDIITASLYYGVHDVQNVKLSVI